MQDMKWTAEGILEAMDALIILENLSPLIDMTTLTTDHGDVMKVTTDDVMKRKDDSLLVEMIEVNSTRDND
jgi:hypothetical protein